MSGASCELLLPYIVVDGWCKWEHIAYYLGEIHEYLSELYNPNDIYYVLDKASVHRSIDLKEMIRNNINTIVLPT